MLIEVDEGFFINAKNISFARLRLKKNRLEFTELGNGELEDIEISNEGKKELCDFFKFDEDFVEILIYPGETQYINIKAISRVSIDRDADEGDVILNIKFINDINPWTETIQEEDATKIINEIIKKIAKTKYVDHF